MKETLKVLNGMLKAGVVQRYAIGGAVAAIYYLEPIDTIGLDIFVLLEVSGSELSILAPSMSISVLVATERRASLSKLKACPFNFCPSPIPSQKKRSSKLRR